MSVNQELLEALKAARQKLEWFVDSYPHDITVSKEQFFVSIDIAIAKAEQSAVSEPVAWTAGHIGDRQFYTTPPAAAVSEPVAYIRKDQLQKAAQSALLCEVTPEPRQDRIGIYTTPRAAPLPEPLTDEQIRQMYIKENWFEMNGGFTWGAASVIARAIEKAHGIVNIGAKE